MVKWFDPISERWIEMPEPAPPIPTLPDVDDVYTLASKLAKQANIWEAIVASARASQITEEHNDQQESD